MSYRKVEKIKVIAPRDLVEKERTRLLKLYKPQRWMIQQFGKTLIEKDGLTHPNGERFNDGDCNVCQREIKPDEKIIHLDFSFCDEYSCGMNICKKCLIKLKKMLK